MRASTTQWSDVERLVLTATAEPGTPEQVAARTGLPVHTVQAQLEVFSRDGLLTKTGYASVSYQLTLTGRTHLTTLVGRPARNAAA